jgi:predicted phosphodiesterase
MRVAALYDIHGNLPALDAVLADVERAGPDLIVTGGDVASGPFPCETIARLRGLEIPVAHVMGNADRELVAASSCDGCATTGDDLMAQGTLWAARQLGDAERAFLASFVSTLVLDVDGVGPTLFCHGSPTSDEEGITLVTPRRRIDTLLAGVDEATVVCGHTHSQFDLRHEAVRVVNAGSVGMPYEAAPAAYWALLGPGIELRRTEYDLRRAAALIRATTWPPAEAFAAENILACPTALEAAAVLEPRLSA